MQQMRWKLILILAISAVFVFLAATQEVRLGLDLQGGIHLVMRVDVQEAVAAEVRDDMEGFAGLLDDEAIEVVTVESVGDAAVVTLASEGDLAQALDLAGEYYTTYNARRAAGAGLEMTLSAVSRDALEDGAVRQALQTIRNRIDEYGVSEPIIQRQGLRGDRILVQLPGVEDPERVKALLRNTALLELKMVQEGPALSRQAILDDHAGTLSPGTEILESEPEEGQALGYYLVDATPAITGRDLKTARLSQDEFQQSAVSFTLNPEGTRKFSQVTAENVGRQMAIVLDDRVVVGAGDRGAHLDADCTDPGAVQRAGGGGPGPGTALGRTSGLDQVLGAALRRSLARSGIDRPRPRRSDDRPRDRRCLHAHVLHGCGDQCRRCPGSEPGDRARCDEWAWSDADLARDRRPDLADRHGGRCQRADLRARSRGARHRQDSTIGSRRRFRQGLFGDRRCQRHDPGSRGLPVPVRHRPGQGLRGDPVARNHGVHVHGHLRVADAIRPVGAATAARSQHLMGSDSPATPGRTHHRSCGLEY